MEKRGEISGKRSFANAAPRETVEHVRERIEAIGWSWHDAAKAAGVSYAVRYSLLRGEGSIGSLRKIEDWLVKEESKHAVAKKSEPHEQWLAIENELKDLGDDELRNMIEGIQEYVRAQKRTRAALRKMFRATPER